MPTTSDHTSFARVPLFAGLTSEQIDHLVRSAERMVYQSGDIIQREDDIPDAAILLISGKAVLVDDVDGAAIDFVAPGSVIGELSMLIETRAVSTVVAKSSVRAFRIPRLRLRAVMERHPAVADHFVDRLKSRLAAMAEEMRRVDHLVANSISRLPLANAHSSAAGDSHPVH